MWSAKCTIILVAALQCSSLENGQPSRKIFRNDYQYIDSMQAFYKIHTVAKKWKDAKEKCEAEGSMLFYPKDEEETNAIVNMWNKTYSFNKLYIGVLAPYSKNIFETIDGLPISSVYNKWGKEKSDYNDDDDEDDYNGGDCVVMFKNGNLKASSCREKNKFLCKKTLASVEWNEPCNLPDLSYEYSEKLGSCYKVFLIPMEWSDAYAHCFIEQSRLAIINSKDEAAFLSGLIRKVNLDEIKGKYLPGAVHLGFRKNDKNWQTIIGNSSLSSTGYTEWGAHQPDGNDKEQCGSMFFNGKLNDINCKEKLLFICERQLNHS